MAVTPALATSSRPLQQAASQPTPLNIQWLARALSTLPAGTSSSTPHTPLQQRLAEAGVADWRVFSRHRYSKLTSETDIENAAIKVAEVCKEGLAAEDVERLFQQRGSPWTSKLQEVFQPNLAYMQGLLIDVTLVRAPYEPASLTPLGRLVRNQPSDMGLVQKEVFGAVTLHPASIADIRAQGERLAHY